jgi:hypothetical protein
METEDGDGGKVVLCLFACLLVRAGARFVFGFNLIGLGFAGAIVVRLHASYQL